MHPNSKTELPDAMITNAQLRLTLAAVRDILRTREAESILSDINRNNLSTEEIPDDLEPALNALAYANLLAHLGEKHHLGQKSADDHTGQITLQLIGRAYFQEMLRQRSTITGFMKSLLSVWAEDKRVKFVLEALVNVQKRLIPYSEPSFIEENGIFILLDYRCPVCVGQQGSELPICGFTSGLIQESIAWATGENYSIEETHCRAKGDDYCRFSISRFPVRASSN